MATPAQIAANLRNAQLSTGPKSAEGKARSAMNALKTGLEAQSLLISGESPEAFAQLIAEYYDRHTPDGPEQRFHLDTAIRHEWLLRRFAKVEEQLWALGGKKLENPITGLELGQYFDSDNPSLMRLHRRIVHSEKAHAHAMAAFHRLQAQENKPATPKLASFRTEARAQRAANPQPQSPPPPPLSQPPTPNPQPRGLGWTGNEPPAWRL